MTKSHRPVADAIARAALVFALTLPVFAGFLGVPAAFAKNGGGNGGGNGNGNSGGNSSASSNVASTSPGNSGNAPGRDKSTKSEVASTSGTLGDAAQTGKVKGLDGQIGALHAVHANLQAFIHANPNSRVGRIATYAKSTIAVEGAAKTLADAQAALALAETTLTDAAAAFAASTDLAAFEAAFPGYADYSLATLTNRLTELSTAVDPLTAEQVAELDALSTVLGSQTALDLASATEAVSGLTDTVDTAAADLAAAQQAAADALAAAANKPVTDQVKAYVDTALEADGILDYYRTQ